MPPATILAKRIAVVALCAGLAFWIAARPLGAAQHVVFFGQGFSFLVFRCVGWAWSLPVGIAAGLGMETTGVHAYTFTGLLVAELVFCAALLRGGRVHALWLASLLYWLLLGIPSMWLLLDYSTADPWVDWVGLLLPLLSSQIAANFSVIVGDFVPLSAVRHRIARRPRVGTLEYVQSCVLFVALMPSLVALDHRFREHEAQVAALYGDAATRALDRARQDADTWLSDLSTTLLNEAIAAAPGTAELTPWPPFTRVTTREPVLLRATPGLAMRDDDLLLSRDHAAADAALATRVTGTVPQAVFLRQLAPPPAGCHYAVETAQTHRGARLRQWLALDYSLGLRALLSSKVVLSISCSPPSGVAAAIETGAAKRVLFALVTALLALALVNMASLRVAAPLRRAFVSLAGTAGISPAAIPGPIHSWLLAPRLLARLVTHAASQLRRDRARMSEMLRHQEQLIHYAPMVLYTLQLDGRRTSRVSFVSGSIKRILGWERSDFSRPGWWEENVHPDDLRQVKQVLDAAVERHQYQLEYRIRAADGSWRYIYDEGIVGGKHADGTLEVIGAMLDITRIVEARERAIADSRLTTLGRLAAGVAHELKQPLNVIGMAASNGERLLSTLHLPEQQAASINGKFKRIQDQVQRAARIVEQMGLTGRVATTTNAGFSVQDAIGAAVSLVGSELAISKIRLQMTLSPERAIVFGNQQLLEQALMNLFLNARDAIVSSRAGRAAGEDTTTDWIDVTLKVDRQLARARIEIADTGGGAEADALEKMFEPFYTTKSVGQGMGLGLSIVYNTVSNFHGTIAARNLERGLGITITLPLLDEQASPAA